MVRRLAVGLMPNPGISSSLGEADERPARGKRNTGTSNPDLAQRATEDKPGGAKQLGEYLGRGACLDKHDKHDKLNRQRAKQTITGDEHTKIWKQLAGKTGKAPASDKHDKEFDYPQTKRREAKQTTGLNPAASKYSEMQVKRKAGRGSKQGKEPASDKYEKELDKQRQEARQAAGKETKSAGQGFRQGARQAGRERRRGRIIRSPLRGSGEGPWS